MTLDIYNVLIGIISAAVFQFVIFAVHIRDYKKEKFLLIWLLGTGFVIAGFFSSFWREMKIYKPMLLWCIIYF